ncbi:MAG: DUF4404 family protein [Kofleriaceae bacterium]
MPTPDIIERVKSLRDELGETQPDLAQAPSVEELKAAIDVVLAHPEDVPSYKSLSDRLLFHYVGFQIDHPKLAASMQAVVDSLATAGL